jgi:hypothetical protein
MPGKPPETSRPSKLEKLQVVTSTKREACGSQASAGRQPLKHKSRNMGFNYLSDEMKLGAAVPCVWA